VNPYAARGSEAPDLLEIETTESLFLENSGPILEILHGCTTVQGYLPSEPVPASEVLPLLAARTNVERSEAAQGDRGDTVSPGAM